MGCGRVRPKLELIRFSKQTDGTFREDKTGKEGGRGAYLCREAACLEKAKKRKFIRFSDCV